MVIGIMFYLYISVNDGVPKTKRTNNIVFEHILIFLNENKRVCGEINDHAIMLYYTKCYHQFSANQSMMLTCKDRFEQSRMLATVTITA